MCVCVCVCMYVSAFVHVCVCMCVCLCVCLCVYTGERNIHESTMSHIRSFIIIPFSRHMTLTAQTDVGA